eukprot:9838915-Heterocapsa_arctica.AAC.1
MQANLAIHGWTGGVRETALSWSLAYTCLSQHDLRGRSRGTLSKDPPLVSYAYIPPTLRPLAMCD